MNSLILLYDRRLIILKMTHQKLRIFVQVIFTPILLIPELIIMLSPLIVFFLPKLNEMALLFVNIVLPFWAIVVLLSAFFGRTYCSHICPITGLFSFISYVKNDRKILSIEYPKVMGRIILFLWTAAPMYVILRNLGNQLGFLPNESIYSQPSINIYYILFALSGILANTYGRTSVLHYTCPFASFMISAGRLGREFGLPAFGFSYDKNLCKQCRACVKKCLVNRNIPEMIQTECINFEECVQCRYCAEKCQFSAITYGLKKNIHL